MKTFFLSLHVHKLHLILVQGANMLINQFKKSTKYIKKMGLGRLRQEFAIKNFAKK